MVNAKGSVLVAAQDDTKLTTIAGAIPVAIEGNLSVGASVGWLQFKRKETEAFVAANTTVTATGLASTDTINAANGGYTISYVERTPDSDNYTLPTFQTSFQSIEQRPDDDSALTQDRNATGNYTAIRGVAVTANSTTTLNEIAASAGGSQNIAIEVSALVSVANGDESGVTHAHIDGEVIAGDLSDKASNADILVTASADFHQLALGGSVGIGGTVATSPSFLGTWLGLDTEAYVQGDAWATGDTFVLAEASEHLTLLSIAAAASENASFDAAVIVATLKQNTTRAYVNDKATVLALGNVLISAVDDTAATSVSGGAALGTGLGGLGASPIIVTISKTTEAYVGASAQVDALGHADATLDVLDGNVSGPGFQNTDRKQIDGLAVQALSSEQVTNYSLAGAGGATAAVAGGVAYTHTQSDTNAYIGDNAAVNQRTTSTLPDGTSITLEAPAVDQSVHVAAANDVVIYHLAGVLAAATTAAVDGAVDVGTIRNQSDAYIGQSAKVNAAKDLDVLSLSSEKATGTAVAAGAGSVSVSGSISVWALGTPFDATYSTNSTNPPPAGQTSAGGSSNALAVSNPNYADFGSYGDAQGQRSDLTSAAGSYENTTADSNGSDATSTLLDIINTITSTYTSASSGTPVSDVVGGVNQTLTDNSDSTTEAYIAASGTGGLIHVGGDVSVEAHEEDYLNLYGGGFNAGMGSFGAGIAIANIHGGAVSHVDGRIRAGGAVTVQGATNGNQRVRATAGQAGAVSAGGAVANLWDDGQQQAYVGSGAEIQAARSLTVSATRGYDKFETISTEVPLGIVAGGGSFATSQASGSTEAFVGNATLGSQVANTTVGDVAVLADSNIDDLSAIARALSIGGATGEGNHARAYIVPDVSAHYDSSQSDSHITGNMSIEALSVAEPTGQGWGIDGGGLAVGVTLTEARANPTVNAYVAKNAKLALPGNGSTDPSKATGELKISALAANDPHADGLASGGGLISGDGTGIFAEHGNPDQNRTSVISAYIGDGATVTSNLDVNVLADDEWSGLAKGHGGDYGALAINVNNATLTISPQVDAYIGAASVTAGGAVIVKSESGEVGSLPGLSFDAGTGFDAAANTITFDEPHGLASGDVVRYDAQGGTPLGGLNDGDLYVVTRVSDITIRLGLPIDASNINDETASLGFDRTHPFLPGDAVIYDRNNQPGIGGLEDGTTYYVNDIDPFTIKLGSTLEEGANLLTATFDGDTDVDTDGDFIRVRWSTVADKPGWFMAGAGINNPGSVVYPDKIDASADRVALITDPFFRTGDLVSWYALGFDQRDDTAFHFGLTPNVAYYASVTQQTSGSQTNWFLQFAATEQDLANKRFVRFDGSDRRTELGL